MEGPSTSKTPPKLPEKTPRESTKSVILGGRRKKAKIWKVRRTGGSGGGKVRGRGPGHGIWRRGPSLGEGCLAEGLRRKGRYEKMNSNYCAEFLKSKKGKIFLKKTKTKKKTTKKSFVFFFFFCSFLKKTHFSKNILYCCNFLDVFGFLSTFSCWFPNKDFCIPKKDFCIPKKFPAPQKIVSQNKHRLRGTLYPEKKPLYHQKSGTQFFFSAYSPRKRR